MENKNNLQDTTKTSELTIRTSDLSQSILLAFERTNTPVRDVLSMVRDINSEFIGLDTKIIQKVIRDGSLGSYGKTYGNLTTQEICVWIKTVYPKGRELTIGEKLAGNTTSNLSF